MIKFRPWKKITARVERQQIRQFLNFAADETKEKFRDGVLNEKKTGRRYRRRGRNHIASSAGQFPAKDSGRLLRSVKKRVTAYDATVGTTVFYGKYLAEGTRKMRKRKMSGDAMRLAMPKIKSRVFRWAVWKR